MMNLRKLTMVVLAAASLSAGTLVACASARHHDPEKRIEYMKKNLNLSDAQATQIKTIYTNNQATFKADRDAIKAAADDNAKKAAFQKMRADREQVQSQVKAVLTADQQAKWAEQMKKPEGHEGHGKWGGKRDQGGGQQQPQTK